MATLYKVGQVIVVRTPLLGDQRLRIDRVVAGSPAFYDCTDLEDDDPGWPVREDDIAFAEGMQPRTDLRTCACGRPATIAGQCYICFWS